MVQAELARVEAAMASGLTIEQVRRPGAPLVAAAESTEPDPCPVCAGEVGGVTHRDAACEACLDAAILAVAHYDSEGEVLLREDEVLTQLREMAREVAHHTPEGEPCSAAQDAAIRAFERAGGCYVCGVPDGCRCPSTLALRGDA